MKPNRQDVEQMVAAFMAVLHSTQRVRRKGDASRLATLSVIGAYPESSPKAISEEVGLHPSYITRQIQAFEEDGHVKVTADPEDGRSCRVKLTARGRAELERLREIGLQRYTSFVAKWDADEVRAFTQLLWKLEQSKIEVSTVSPPSGSRWRQQKK